MVGKIDPGGGPKEGRVCAGVAHSSAVLLNVMILLLLMFDFKNSETAGIHFQLLTRYAMELRTGPLVCLCGF